MASNHADELSAEIESRRATSASEVVEFNKFENLFSNNGLSHSDWNERFVGRISVPEYFDHSDNADSK